MDGELRPQLFCIIFYSVSNMNREILFRGFNEKNNKWIYGYYFVNRGLHFIVTDEIQTNPLVDWTDFVVNPDTIGQYTGLKDKNRKQIFEGDIVKGVSHKSDSCISELIPFDVIGVVGYHKEYQTLEVSTRQASLHIEVAIKGEVIGNIHDNPELIK